MIDKKSLALFDLDGTLTAGDSLFGFILYAFGLNRVVFGAVLLMPYLIAYRLKILDGDSAKEAVFKHFFANKRVSLFDSLAQDYFDNHLKMKLRKSGLQKLQWHINQGHDVVVVSASAFWVYPVTKYLGVECICTLLEERSGIYTGFYQGKNCNRSEKVRRIKEIYDIDQYREVFAYGDSDGDTEMLSISSHRFYRPFR
tara:strand:- start:111 stop:707 length:597 start_codon:yes stop_codon:yes gene_type:complete